MLRPDTAPKEGEKYIYLYANVNGSKTFISVGSLVPEKSWNAKDQTVRAGIANQRTINNKLAQIGIQINNLINRADSAGNTLTVLDLKNIVKDGGNTDSFFLFMEKEISRLNCTLGTKKIYQCRLDDLKKFRSNLRFADITPSLWYEYEEYLVGKGNKKSTIFDAYIQTNRFINRAVNLDILIVNPWSKIKVKKGNGNRQLLTDEEIKLVRGFYEKTEIKKLKSLLRAFLFSCYTGLRFDNVKKITGKNIHDGRIYVTVKGGKQQDLKLSKSAIALLPDVLDNRRLFIFSSNSKAGKYLTIVMNELKINKKITFHCARHSFATFMLGKTGDIQLVSKLLNHASIQTTQIYAKTLESAKDKAMDLIDEL